MRNIDGLAFGDNFEISVNIDGVVSHSSNEVARESESKRKGQRGRAEWRVEVVACLRGWGSEGGLGL